MNRYTFFFLTFLFSTFSVYAVNVDSLKNVGNDLSVSPKERFDAFIEIYLDARFFDAEKTFDAVNRAGEVAKEYNNDSLIAEYYFHRGIAESIHKMYDASVHSFDSALSHYKATENYSRIAYCYRNTGVSHRSMGNLNKASEYLYSSLNIYEELSDSLMISLVNFDLGSVLLANEDFKDAKKYFQEVLNYQLQHKEDARQIAVVYNALGLTEEYLGKNGLSYFNKSIRYYKSINDSNSIMNNLNNIGMHYLNIKQPDSALYYLNQVIDYNNRVNSGYNRSATFVNMAQAKLLKKDYSSALEYAQIGIEYAEKYNEQTYLINGLDILTHLYDSLGQDDKALLYLHKARDAEKKLLNTEKQVQLAKIRSNYQLERKEIENLRQRKEIASQQRLIEKQETATLLLVLLIGTIIVFVLILGTWLVRIKRINTSLSKLKIELELKEQDLTKSNAHKDQLLSIIAHDLRSPIGNIQSLLSLYKPFQEDEDKHLLAQKSATDAMELLENLLDWAKSQQATADKYEINPVNLRTIFNKEVEYFKVSARSKNITLKHDFSDEIVFVEANIESLKTVIRNLISNALKFTPNDGYVMLSHEIVDDLVIITVKDSGIGIDPDTLEKLNNNKPVTSLSGTNKETGSGLGLVIVRRFLEICGSKLQVNSQVGKGSSFSFSLPLAK